MKATITMDLEITAKSSPLTEDDLHTLLENTCARMSSSAHAAVPRSRELEVEIEGLPPRGILLQQSVNTSWRVNV